MLLKIMIKKTYLIFERIFINFLLKRFFKLNLPLVKKVKRRLKFYIYNTVLSNPIFLLRLLSTNKKKLIDEYCEYTDIEHQVGRAINMKKIVDEICIKNLSGDVIEFGTYKGLGLCLLNQFFFENKYSNNNRLFIGVDSFEGLPHSSNIWKKGQFSDAEMEKTQNFIIKESNNQINLSLIKAFFEDKNLNKKIYDLTNDLILVHFDADLGSSTKSALSIIEKFIIERKKPIYFLFDDWGDYPEEVPKAYNSWLEKMSKVISFKSKEIYATKNTRYFRLEFN